jgi:hypothetical protein
LTIRTEIAIHESFKRWGQLVASNTETAHNPGRDIFRDISGPPFGRVEGRDEDWGGHCPDIRSEMTVSKSARSALVSQ